MTKKRKGNGVVKSVPVVTPTSNAQPKKWYREPPHIVALIALVVAIIGVTYEILPYLNPQKSQVEQRPYPEKSGTIQTSNIPDDNAEYSESVLENVTTPLTNNQLSTYNDLGLPSAFPQLNGLTLTPLSGKLMLQVGNQSMTVSIDDLSDGLDVSCLTDCAKCRLWIYAHDNRLYASPI